MEVNLIKAEAKDAAFIWDMQKEAFAALYEKYHDTETNPAAEPIERVLTRLQQPFTYYYLIEYSSTVVGAIRIIDHKTPELAKRISPVFILPSYRKRGFAQKAIIAAEKIHGPENWQLETIREEAGLCLLYEKLGYRQTAQAEKIHACMTLVSYEK